MFRFPSDIDSHFREMQRRHDELFRSMFESDPFTETVFQSPFHSMRTSTIPRTMLRDAPQSPARIPRTESTPLPTRQRQVSVSEVDPYVIEDPGVSEAEKQDLEEAIRLSLLEDQKKRAPVVQDLDDDDIEEIYARHAQSHSPATVRSPPRSPGTRSNPISLSNDNYERMVIDDDGDVTGANEDDDAELKAAIEASLESTKMDEIRRQERDLVLQQREEYEASVREDMEIERKKQWKINWVSQASQSDNLPFEPQENDPNAVKLVIKLPDGNRLNRRFFRTDTINTVKQFVDYEVSTALKATTSPSPLEAFIPDSPQDITYDLATDFPNKLFENSWLTLEQAQLAPRAMISARLRSK